MSKHLKASRRLAMCVIGLLVAAVAGPGVIASPAGADGWQRPGFVRSIGGRGEAGVYAWGMEYNPVTDEILVGDYWNFKIRRYDRVTGRQIGAFFRPTNVRRGQPYTISVNPVNGDIYVPEWGDGQMFSGAIGRYDKLGNYLGEVKIPAAYHVWTHVDAQGFLWVADSHFWNTASFPPQIRKFDLANPAAPVQVLAFGTFGSAPGQLSSDVHGISTDGLGNIYTADAINRTVHVFAPDGTWIKDIGSAGEGTGLGRFMGDLRGLEIDRANGLLYVVDAEAGEIEQFSLGGTALAHWGSEGSGLGQFGDGAREVAVDSAGHLWAADYGNYRFMEYNATGALLRTLPNPAQPPPPGNFSENRDVAVAPNGDVWVADAWNNRFQRFGADGSFKGTWGARNSHPPYGMNYPRGIAIDPDTGNVWVVNTREHVIRVYDSEANYIDTIGNGVKSEDPGSFVWPLDVEFHGGKAYVTNYYGSSVRILDVASLTETGRVSTTNNGVAVDPSTGNIYVLTWGRDRVSVYTPDGVTRLFTFGTTGSGPGQFDNPWDIDIVNGTVYVTDAKLGRVQAFGLDGTYLGGWGTKGTGAFQFNSPSGITHDAAGNIYIADAGNGRVLVFSPTVALPSGDTVKPAVTLTTPLANALLPAQSPAVIRGTATDAVGVAKVEVAVKDTVRSLWWNATDAVWQPVKTFGFAAVSGPANTSLSYAFSFIAVERGGRYSVSTKATDTSGNFTVSAQRTFRIAV